MCAGKCAMLAAMARRSDGEASTAVYIESGSKRVFACALEWPGWCRSGKNEAQALEALAAAAQRYAVVAAAAGLPFPTRTSITFDVVERLPGSASTDFGAPGEIASRDTQPLMADEAGRLAELVAASWRSSIKSSAELRLSSARARAAAVETATPSSPTSTAPRRPTRASSGSVYLRPRRKTRP